MNKVIKLINAIKQTVWKFAIYIFCSLPVSNEKKVRFKQKLYKKFGKQLNAFKGHPDENQELSKKKPESFVQWEDNTPIAKPPVKVIAFYLPQFHPIPENDKWWGKGFTEWINVKPAQPQFEGHYQPHIPVDLGYYNLLNIKTFRRQIEQAKNYGVGGFCFHYYWFNKKRLLEKPIDLYLENPSLDFPFCISWANESWSRRWDGNEKNVLLRQNHSPEDDIDFISFASKYLKDKRYIKIDGKPLLMIYRPDLLPDPNATTKRWRDWSKQNGIGDIYLAYVQSFEKTPPGEYGFDAAVEFPPNHFGAPYITHTVKPLNDDFKCNILDWKFMADESENYKQPGYKLFRGVCPAWDNTARRKNESYVFINSTPERFKKWVFNAAADTLKRFDNPEERLVFVNAWNEWAEGAHLEPDLKYGYAYLQNIYDVLFSLRNGKPNTITKKPKLLMVTYNIPRPNRSSGELRFVAILELLTEFWNVDFCIIPSHAEWNHNKDLLIYKESLVTKGINVLPIEKNSFDKAINNNKYEVAYFNLYWVAEEVLQRFKGKQPHAKIIVDSVDVHFAREETQVKIGQLESEKAAQTKHKELAIYKASDVTIAVSKDDFELLANKEQVGKVTIVPNIVPTRKRKNGKRNKKVLFIGSYTWYPNLSAVKWFVSDIWPLVIKKNPEAEFLIIGSDPTKEILELNKHQGVRVLGFVQSTEPYYEISAVSVAPLLVGGGMKGKVNEALSYGVPVVATSIGAQGFNAINEEEMFIADDVNSFVGYVNKLLNDDKLQESVGLAGQKLNASICSKEVAKEKIKELFDYLSPLNNKVKLTNQTSREKNESLSTYNVINFDKLPEKPMVSIIIPVYNQWDYTYACLKSILKNSKGIQYEIILADDNSTDETKEVEKYVKNIKVIRNEKNLGFLYNCNNAANSVLGKYIIFLNNDTLVQPEWLKWFMKTMEEKPNIGLASAKVVFSTGKLQEAGSIVFKDGSAMNYGREDDPKLPQYNYFKDVDYGSGCSICVRTDLWKKAGGFDTRYAPAYYEDTDLAVQVRQMGYRIVYQPKAEIIHFEGGTHGTDLTAGIKKNQIKNQKIFYKKWKEELEKNNFDRDENLFRARERSMHKKMVLLVDHHIPNTPFSDKTNKAINIINHFAELNYMIKFLPDDFQKPDDFVTEFEQQGIEFLYGEQCKNEWRRWLHENINNFDLICFAEKDLKEKYSPILSILLTNNFKSKLYNQILQDEQV